MDADKRFVENMRSQSIKLFTLSIYQFKLNLATVPLANPFEWPSMHQIGAIHRIYIAGGANAAHNGDDVCGEVVFVAFPPYKPVAAGFFSFLLEP